jgi:hypothetical protein
VSILQTPHPQQKFQEEVKTFTLPSQLSPQSGVDALRHLLECRPLREKHAVLVSEQTDVGNQKGRHLELLRGQHSPTRFFAQMITYE